MANALYAKGKENLLDAKFDLNTTEQRVTLTDESGGAPVLATDDAFDDISAKQVAGSNALTTPTITNGVFDADDEPLTAVSGASVESLTVYQHNATASLAYLLVYINVDSGGNLPFTPTGGDVTISWNASGIFAL